MAWIKKPLLLAALLALLAPVWAAESEAPARLNAGYGKGFFITDGDRFALRLQSRVQTRYTLNVPETGDHKSAFSIPRARLSLSGHAFTEALSYKFDTDFGKGFVSLKDFYVNYQLGERLQFRVGQWKRPFSRQQLNSSGRLELIDRAITDKFFGSGRDIGIAIHGSAADFEYAFGVFNGTGDKPVFSGEAILDTDTGDGLVTGGTFSNVPAQMRPVIVTRIGYDYGGINGYSEADLQGGPLRFAIGASALVDLDRGNADSSAIRGEIDFALKLHGFSSVGGVYLASVQSGAGFAEQAFDAVGFHLQAGYMLTEQFQAAFRYALIAPDGADNNQQEIMAGLSAYFFGHGLKLQLDGGALIAEETGGSRTDYLFRTQFQLSF